VKSNLFRNRTTGQRDRQQDAAHRLQTLSDLRTFRFTASGEGLTRREAGSQS
jgi:hypothetical protein